MTTFYANFKLIAKIKPLTLLSLVLCFAIGQAQTTFIGDNLGSPIVSLSTTSSSATSNLTGSYNVDYVIKEVIIDITHTWDGDLDIDLISPDGTRLELSIGNGLSDDSDNYTNTRFQDGAIDINTFIGPYSFVFAPEGGTFDTAFDGEDINGQWTLEVADTFTLDDGTLNNFQITFDIIQTCFRPSNVTTTNITDDSLNLSWDIEPTETNGYDWVLMASGDNPNFDFPLFSGSTSPVENSVTINGLTSNTVYDAYVRSNCGGGSLSWWSIPVRFATLCDVFTPDFLESFPTNILPCWSFAESGTPATGPSNFGITNWEHAPFANVGSTANSVNINLFFNDLESWIISPLIDLSGGNYELSYLTAITDWNNSDPPELNGMGSDDEIQVLITTDAGSTWQNLKTYSLAEGFPGHTGENEIIDLSAYIGEIVRIAFWATDGSVSDLEDYDFFIDEFEIREAPTCIAPTGLSASNITPTSVELSWSPSVTPPSFGYEYVILPAGSPSPDATTTPTGSVPTGTTVTDTSLTPATAYDGYVRTYCTTGPDDKSAWSDVVNFTTNCQAESIPWEEDFESMAMTGPNIFPGCWSPNSGTAFGTGDGTASGTAPNGSALLYHALINQSTIYTPAFSLTASQTYEFSFLHKVSSAPSDQSFEVYVGNTPDFMSMSLEGSLTDVPNTNFVEFNITFTPTTTNDYYFALRVIGNAFTGIGFDDFALEEVTGAIDYTYSAIGGGYTPSDPSGVNEPASTLTVLDGNAVISSPTTLGSITVKPGAVLDPNADITADFVFESDETGFGQLGDTSGTTITGRARVENYVPAKRAFRAIASSVSGVSVADSWQQQIHVTGSGGATNGFDETQTNNASMYEFDHMLSDQNSPWVSIPNTDHLLEAGHPYYLMVRGDRTTDLTDNNATPSIVTLSAEGTLHTGPISVVTSNFSQNYSLVGNPYQAIVNLNDLYFGADVNNTYAYYWDPMIGTLGDYVEILISDGSSPSSTNADQFLRPGQAVFIRNEASASDYSIQFTEAAKDTGGSQTVVFSSPTDSKYVNLRIYSTERYYANETEEDALGIRFSENANNGTDRLDAGKLFNLGVNLARINNDGTLISIENRDLPEHGENLPLFINNLMDQDYTLYLEAENFEETQKLFLIDTYTNQIHPLTQGSNNIEFTADTSIPESTDTQRFQLLFENETFNLDEPSLTDQIIMYPVPVKNLLNIKNTLNVDLGVEIYSALGQKIIQATLTQNERKQLSLEHLSTGLYLVKLDDGSSTFYKKILKN